MPSRQLPPSKLASTITTRISASKKNSPRCCSNQATKTAREPLVVNGWIDVSEHTRNFLDCLKSRKACNCPVEIGHRSTSMALLANISLATESTLHWDPQRERITNIPEANDLLHYEYRKPWTLEDA